MLSCGRPAKKATGSPAKLAAGSDAMRRASVAFDTRLCTADPISVAVMCAWKASSTLASTDSATPVQQNDLASKGALAA